MQREKTGVYIFAESVIVLLLFLANMNFGNYYVYLLFMAGAISVLVTARSIKIDYMLVVLLLFSFCYLLFYPKATESATTLLKQFLYPLCYLMGLNYIQGEDGQNFETNEHKMTVIILVCALGTFVHYLLNMSINYASLLRNNVDIWSGEIMLATRQAALAVPALGVFVTWLFDNKKKKLGAAVGLVLVMAYNLVLAGRTLILLTVVLLVVAFWFAHRTTQSRHKGRLVAVMLLLLFFSSTAYLQNWFGIREHILGSNLSARFDEMTLGEDQRTNNKLQYIGLMLEHPFGGGAIRNAIGGYAHELYLDVYSDAGIITYLLVLVFAIASFGVVWKIIRRGLVSDSFKLLLLCVFLAFLMEFHLEPIIQGMPWMFCTFCLWSGMLRNVQIERS